MANTYIECPEIQELPFPDAGQKRIRNYTGMYVDRIIVVGYHGKKEKQVSKNGNKLAPSKRHEWVIRCTCLLYSIKSHHDLSRCFNRKGIPVMCPKCYAKFKKG